MSLRYAGTRPPPRCGAAFTPALELNGKFLARPADQVSIPTASASGDVAAPSAAAGPDHVTAV